ncbi:SCC2 [Candida pseudojiufengensis]|uniref:SCC2 n=1 Tax=Candida pseudojiufengensis TaxID=497109 RepID=UPI00222452D1|nr:SCC2 [Candida pseudojiufengensis]KAI5965980.1 SCC2 [Candida pseudojiufengensis]
MSNIPQPDTLKPVLATTPLLHLIPKQNLSPLINLSSLAPVIDASVFARPTYIEQFVSKEAKDFELECQNELLEFEDDELDDIKFINHDHESRNDDSHQPPEYSEFELELLKNVSKKTKENTLHEEEDLVPTTRLSVRSQIPIDDDSYSQKHNFKYFTKFQRQSGSFFDKNTINQLHDSEDITPPINIPHVPPVIEQPISNVHVSIFDQFIQDGPSKITWERTALLCDSLHKTEILKKEENSNLIQIEELFSQALSDIVENSKKLDNLDEVGSLLPNLLVGVFASKAIIMITKFQIENQTKTFEKYISIIVDTLEIMYNNFLTSLIILYQDTTDSFTEKSITKLVVEFSNRLNQLNSLKTIISDQVLTKLETLCMSISFSNNINNSEKFGVKFPIHNLQQSAANCLVSIFKDYSDQRQGLLSNILIDFSSLEIKRQNAKNHKTGRHFPIQLFTKIVNDFAVLEDPPTNVTELVSSELIKKLQENPSENKLKFDIFIDDLFDLLPFPEFPASDIFIFSIIDLLMQTLDMKDEPIAGEVQLLDCLVNICERILNQKYEKDMFLDEEALKLILGNSLVYDSTKASYEYLKTRLERLTNIILEQEPIKHKNEEPIEPYRAMVLSRLSQLVLTKYYNFIVRQLNNSKAKVRAKSLKGLQMFLQEFPQLLATQEIMKSLTDRLHDSAISVRDAMNDFLGEYVKKNPTEAEKLINPLYLALDDPGISVKKSAIKSCLQNFNFVGKLARLKIVIKFLERSGDEEDGVRNEAKSALLEIFFKEKEGINELIGVAKERRSLLKSFLEQNFEKVPADTVTVLVDVAINSDNSEEIEGAFNAIAIIAQFKPELITQDILSDLKPIYLDTDHINTPAYTNALLILKSSTSKLTSIRPELSLDLQNFLYHKLIFFQSHDISLAVQSLANLGRLSSTEIKGVTAVISAMKIIREYHDRKTYEKIFKHLQILGNFGKYFPLQKFRNEFVSEGIVPSNYPSVMSILIRYIMAFIPDKFPRALRKYAFTNVLLACSSVPRFFGEIPILNIIETALTMDDEIKFNVIKAITEFINDNGEKIESTEFNSKDLEQKLKESGYNACEILVSKFFDKIGNISLSSSSNDLSEIAFVFVRKALKLDLILPMKGINIIIALHGSKVLRIQQSASNLYSELYDKNKSVVDTQLISGIKLAFENNLIANNLISLLYNKNSETKSSRNKFIKSISKLYSMKSKPKLTKQELLFLVFLTERIFQIKFKTIGEIYIILEQLYSNLQYNVPEFMSDVNSNGVQKDDLYKGLLIHLLLEFYDYLSITYNISFDNIEAFSSRYLEADLDQAPKVIKSAPEIHFEWIFDHVDDIKSLERAAFIANKSTFNPTYIDN